MEKYIEVNSLIKIMEEKRQDVEQWEDERSLWEAAGINSAIDIAEKMPFLMLEGEKLIEGNKV